MSRQTDFTPELAATRIAEGESLRSICRDGTMPATSTVMRWVAENESFQEQYVRAREMQADAMFEEMLGIADDGHNDWMMRNFGDEARWVENGETINRSKLRVDARKWALARMSPRKYGERLDLNHSGKVAMSHEAALAALDTITDAHADTEVLSCIEI